MEIKSIVELRGVSSSSFLSETEPNQTRLKLRAHDLIHLKLASLILYKIATECYAFRDSGDSVQPLSDLIHEIASKVNLRVYCHNNYYGLFSRGKLL